MEKGSKAAIVCCSNGQPQMYKDKINQLEGVLTQAGLIPVFGNFIYAKDNVFSGTGEERARSLMEFYRDDEIKAIFDISGGDIANELLPYLDFDLIAQCSKPFWGYSDLTTIINGIYAKTGVKSVLYQIKNLVLDDTQNQIANFTNAILNGTGDLFNFHYEFVQKDAMQGIVVGGNMRCLLKLAGTPYWPDMEGKLLLLEGLRGMVPQIAACLNQLKQIGVFGQVEGILLGTFTEMEEKGGVPTAAELVKQYAGKDMPIAKTNEIGHGYNSKAIVIGETVSLKKNHPSNLII